MNCEACSSRNYLPTMKESYGDGDSDILVVAYSPNVLDHQNKAMFLKPDDNILRTELSNVSYSLMYAEQTFLWPHEPCDNEKHLNERLAVLMHKMKNKKAVLMIGAKLAQIFTGHSITNINGLEMPSILTPKDVSVTYIYDPSMAANKSIGEFRLAIQKFVRRLS